LQVDTLKLLHCSVENQAGAVMLCPTMGGARQLNGEKHEELHIANLRMQRTCALIALLAPDQPASHCPTAMTS